MQESKILADIRQDLGLRPDVRLFRNNVGALMDRDGRLVRYGLGTGTSDLIGPRMVTVTPDMVGRTLAVFCAIEAKTQRGRVTPEQLSFIHMVRSFGGYAGIARSVEDARAIVDGYLI